MRLITPSNQPWRRTSTVRRERSQETNTASAPFGSPAKPTYRPALAALASLGKDSDAQSTVSPLYFFLQRSIRGFSHKKAVDVVQIVVAVILDHKCASRPGRISRDGNSRPQFATQFCLSRL